MRAFGMCVECECHYVIDLIYMLVTVGLSQFE